MVGEYLLNKGFTSRAWNAFKENNVRLYDNLREYVLGHDIYNRAELRKSRLEETLSSEIRAKQLRKIIRRESGEYNFRALLHSGIAAFGASSVIYKLPSPMLLATLLTGVALKLHYETLEARDNEDRIYRFNQYAKTAKRLAKSLNGNNEAREKLTENVKKLTDTIESNLS